MPKRSRSLHSENEEPIASRTRLRLGSPMRRTVPVQYPQHWPLLTESESDESRSNSSTRRPRKQALSKNKTRKKPCSRAPKVKGRSRRILSEKNKRQIAPRKKCFRSKIQVVTYRRSGKRQRKSTRKSTRQKIPRGRKSRGRKRRNQTKRKRKGKKGNARRRTGYKRKTTRRKGVRKCARKRTRSKSQPDAKRRKLDHGHNFREDYNYVFGPPPQTIADNLDQGLDEPNDDPLNVGAICRAIVNSLPVAPADARNAEANKKNLNAQNGEVRTVKRKMLKRKRNVKGSRNTKKKRATKKKTNRGRPRKRKLCKQKRTKAVGRTKTNRGRPSRRKLCRQKRTNAVARRKTTKQIKVTTRAKRNSIEERKSLYKRKRKYQRKST